MQVGKLFGLIELCRLNAAVCTVVCDLKVDVCRQSCFVEQFWSTRVT